MTSYAETMTTRDNVLGGRAGMAAVAAMIAALFAGSTALTPLYIIYKQAFGFSQITLTLVYAVYVVGNLGALLMFGRLSDGVGRRPAALAAMAVAVASALVFLLAENVAWLDVARILSGLGIGVGAGTGTAWLAELIEGEDKSRAAVIATSTNFVGRAGVRASCRIRALAAQADIRRLSGDACRGHAADLAHPRSGLAAGEVGRCFAAAAAVGSG